MDEALPVLPFPSAKGWIASNWAWAIAAAAINFAFATINGAFPLIPGPPARRPAHPGDAPAKGWFGEELRLHQRAPMP